MFSAALRSRVLLPVLAATLAAPPALAATAADSALAPPRIAPPRLSGYVQIREVGQERVGLTSVLNRARFSIDGPLPSRLAYRILVETEASAGAKSPATMSLREAIVKWSRAPFTVTAGEFKTPFTREYLIPVPALELADLATVIDSLAPKYDVGLMAEYAWHEHATVAVAMVNGEGANSTANRDSSVTLVARVAVRPLPQLALGASATRDGQDSLRWGVDGSVQEAGVVVRAEYASRHLRRHTQVEDDFGWYVFESFRLTPRLQLVARQEDFQRPSQGPARRVRGLAWGTNVELAPNRVRLLLELSRRMSGKLQRRTDGLIAQLQVQF